MLRDRPMKILIADDDRISRRLMERTLQRSGYDVTTVEDGLQAVEELSKPDGPRLALIDWMMPKLDGTALCREIRGRKNERYVYMVLLTANELNEDLVTGLQAGADDYLTKPCHSAELNARLHAGRRILLLEDQLMAATEAMRFKATHDALTSLWDRGAIISMLRSALSRSSREERPVSIMLCDVDHFKNINDVHGHIVGDEVLREVPPGAGRMFRGPPESPRRASPQFHYQITVLNFNRPNPRYVERRRPHHQAVGWSNADRANSRRSRHRAVSGQARWSRSSDRCGESRLPLMANGLECDS